MGEKHQCVVASPTPPTGDLAGNTGMCPDWESNWRPFVFAGWPSITEPRQPGQILFFSMAKSYSTVYMHHSFFIHSSTDEHLGCFREYCGLHEDHASEYPPQ